MKPALNHHPVLLSVSHSAVVSGYRKRYSEVGRQSNMAVNLLVPQRWRQFNRMIDLEVSEDSSYRIIARQPITWGISNHGLRNVAHIYPGLEQLFRELRPDIVELWEEPFSAVTFQVIRAAKRITPQAPIIFFSAQNIRKNHPPPFSWFESYAYRRADFAFVINREAAKVIEEKGWEEESLVLPLGVDPGVFKPLNASARRAELGLDKFTVGFVGKLEAQKGLLELLRAVAGLDGEADLLIIGDGPLLNRARRLAGELGLTGKTRFIPAVPYDSMPGFLNCLDVLVFPSVTEPGLKEQFGRVLVEAMSCAVPVIGSDSGEIPNVIGVDGLIFPEGDSRQLTERIEALRRDPARRKELGGRGRARVRKLYSWEEIARQQIAVYNRLLGEGANPPAA